MIKHVIIEVFSLKCPEWSRVIVNATQSTRFVTADFKGNQLNLICFHLAEINQKDEETCVLSDKVDHLRLTSSNRPVAYPNGLRLIEDFITPEDESRIINRLLSFEKFFSSNTAPKSITSHHSGEEIDKIALYVGYYTRRIRKKLLPFFYDATFTNCYFCVNLQGHCPHP